MTTVKLGRVASLRTTQASEGEFRIGLEAVESGTGRLVDEPNTEYKGDGAGFVAGDVLFGKLRPYLAKAWLADRAGAAVGDFHVYRPREGVLDGAYLRYVLLSSSFLGPVVSSVFGAKMPRADWDFIRNVELYVPSLREQRTIVQYLDRETAQLDAFISKSEQLIDLLAEGRAAVLASMLDSVAGAYTRLKYLAQIQTGVTLSGEGIATDPEWPYLRVANVQVGRVDLAEVKTLRLATSKAIGAMLRPGDVLMTEGGDADKLGRGALWDGQIAPMLHQNHVFAVRAGSQLAPRFLTWWLDGPVARAYFERTAKQTTNLASTNKATVGNLPIAQLTRSAQARIVDALDAQTGSLEGAIAATRRGIRLARERRSALISAVVTGKNEVPRA